VRIQGLPPNTQEGLLQQTLEKIAPIKRLEVFEDKREAVAELESAAVRIKPFRLLHVTTIMNGRYGN
jgi:hypothetical protein